VLAEAGYSPEEVNALLTAGIAVATSPDSTITASQ
jgi:hypothetical protein